MFGDDKIYYKFQALCGIPEGSDEPLYIGEIRQILLFRSSGLCPARLLVSMVDGSILSRKEICQPETLTWAKRKSWFDFRGFEKLKDETTKHESKFISSTSYKCSLSRSQADELRKMVAQCKGDCKAFRRQLLMSKNIETVSIHFFRWDGSPRASIAEIEKAICIYPSSPKRMNIFLKLFLGIVVGTIAYGAYKAIQYERASDSGVFSKLKCSRIPLTIYLVGETHGAHLSRLWLPLFLAKLEEEKEKPESIIYVEHRPWDYDNKRPFTDDPRQMRKFMLRAEIAGSPIAFWQKAGWNDYVATKFPKHEMVAYDYRYRPFWDELVELTQGYSAYDQDRLSLLPDEYLEIYAKRKQDMHRIFERQLKFLMEFHEGAGRGQPFLTKFLSEFATLIRTFTEKFEELSMRDAQKLVDQLHDFWMNIPDHTLTALLISQKTQLMAKGIDEVYVFMGYKHIPNTEKVLSDELGCKKTAWSGNLFLK